VSAVVVTWILAGVLALVTLFLGMMVGGLARAAALPTPKQEVRKGTIYKRGDVVVFETDQKLSAEAFALVRDQSMKELEDQGVKVVLLEGGIHARKFVGAKPCPTCGKDLARSAQTDSLRDLTFNGRRIASVTLYGDLTGDFTLSEEDAPCVDFPPADPDFFRPFRV